METAYLVCAIVGGTLIVCQFLLTVLGLGHADGHDFGGHDVGSHDVGGHDTGHDGGHEHGASWFFGWLTFRTLSAAVAFFGLAGLAATHGGLEPIQSLAVALAAGLAALVVVGWLMRGLSRLNVDGTTRIERAVGSRGTVYLSIPAGRGGVGKVQLSLQSRTVECKAITAQAGGLATGTTVVVVAVIGPDTVEVTPATELLRTHHD